MDAYRVFFVFLAGKLGWGDSSNRDQRGNSDFNEIHFFVLSILIGVDNTVIDDVNCSRHNEE